MALVAPAYRYRATLDRAIDGDTFMVNLDLGLRVHAIVPIRLRNYNAPELPTIEGVQARVRALELFAKSTSVVVETFKDQQSFARFVADIYLDGVSLVTLLQQAP